MQKCPECVELAHDSREPSFTKAPLGDLMVQVTSTSFSNNHTGGV